MEGTMLEFSGPSMVDEKLARLRYQAEHCRRLALEINDDRTISALQALAFEYDDQADQMERNGRKRRAVVDVRPLSSSKRP